MTPDDLLDLPHSATWRHLGPRDGFEVLFAATRPDGHRLRARTTAVEGGTAWSVGFDDEVDRGWMTRAVDVVLDLADGTRRLRLTRDSRGAWTVDGVPRPDLDGCTDVDLESSAVTNTLPLHRVDLSSGRPVDVPAAFVRVDGAVQRLEQTYALAGATADGIEVDYTSSTFDVACRLRYDRAGLVVDYPDLAVRHS